MSFFNLWYPNVWKMAKPLLKMYFKKRAKKDSSYLEHLEERFLGSYNNFEKEFFKVKNLETIHFHAASLGEVNLITPLIKEFYYLQKQELLNPKYQQAKIVITTNTPTGRKSVLRLQQQLGEEFLTVCYTPLEYERAIVNFINTFNPIVSCFVETEIWPLLINQLADHHPIYLLNARLSLKDSKKYKKGLLYQSIKRFTKIIAQSDLNALLFANIFAKHSFTSEQLLKEKEQELLTNFTKKEYSVEPKIQENLYRKNLSLNYLQHKQQEIYSANNLKFCKNTDNLFQVWSKIWHLSYKELNALPITIIHASTYPDEVELLINSLQSFQDTSLLVVAPRHPENFKIVKEQFIANGYFVTSLSLIIDQFRNLQRELDDCLMQSLNLHTKDRSLTLDTFRELTKTSIGHKILTTLDSIYEILGFNAITKQKVLLVDTIGDLNKFYSLAQVTIVGGTFNKVGGHDFIEPLANLNSIISGANYRQQQSVVESLLDLNAVNIVEAKDPALQSAELALKLKLYNVTQHNTSSDYKIHQLQTIQIFNLLTSNSINQDCIKAVDFSNRELTTVMQTYQFYLEQQNSLINHLYITEFIKYD